MRKPSYLAAQLFRDGLRSRSSLPPPVAHSLPSSSHRRVHLSFDRSHHTSALSDRGKPLTAARAFVTLGTHGRHIQSRALDSCEGCAEVAELADAHGSGPCTRKGVEVRVLSSAPGFPGAGLETRSRQVRSSSHPIPLASLERLDRRCFTPIPCSTPSLS